MRGERHDGLVGTVAIGLTLSQTVIIKSFIVKILEFLFCFFHQFYVFHREQILAIFRTEN
jgi:hypothetical protein